MTFELTTYRVRNWIVARMPASLRPAVRYWRRRLAGDLEPELAWLVAAVREGSTAVDVGANVGVYSYALSRRARRVVAFEPLAPCADQVRGIGGVEVHQVALSDVAGELDMTLPVIDGVPVTPWASLHPTTLPHRLVRVPVRRLDDFALRDVSAMKIDTEGNEVAVLEGAIETIRRERPALVVEVEARHVGPDGRDVVSTNAAEVRAWLTERVDYRCVQLRPDSSNLVATPSDR